MREVDVGVSSVPLVLMALLFLSYPPLLPLALPLPLLSLLVLLVVSTTGHRSIEARRRRGGGAGGGAAAGGGGGGGGAAGGGGESSAVHDFDKVEHQLVEKIALWLF